MEDGKVMGDVVEDGEEGQQKAGEKLACEVVNGFPRGRSGFVMVFGDQKQDWDYALGLCMLGQLAGQEQPDGGLDLARGDGRPTEKTNKTPHIDSPFVVVCQLASLCSDSLEEVVDK